MKKKHNNLIRASAVQVTFISVSAVLLTLGAAPARNQFEREPAGTSVTLQDQHHRASLSEEDLIPPAGLKPVEQEAWLAMARRQRESEGMGDPSWVNSASMGTVRQYHTATLLQSGKVLVAGGVGSSGYLSSAELFDPASGTWIATGSMGTARYLHTAMLMPSGKVLVAGGHNDTNGDLNSAELYDPASGTWTATGSLRTGRRFHTATLLSSGKVLVVGGVGNSSLLSSGRCMIRRVEHGRRPAA